MVCPAYAPPVRPTVLREGVVPVITYYHEFISINGILYSCERYAKNAQWVELISKDLYGKTLISESIAPSKVVIPTVATDDHPHETPNTAMIDFQLTLHFIRSIRPFNGNKANLNNGWYLVYNARSMLGAW